MNLQKEKIAANLLPLAEKWSGIELEYSVLYGIRRYIKGNRLSAHTDISKTHIISAIINVDQDIDEPWPLQILDHSGQPHNIYLEPGEMVWYESAK